MNAKPLVVFVDTNVLMDLLFQREPYYANAQTIFWLAEQKRITIQLSVTSFVNTDFVCKRYGYNHVQLRKIFHLLEQIVTIPNLGGKAVSTAIHSQITDFEDAIQESCAKAGKADLIVTRNIKDFEASTIPCYLPQEFLRMHKTLLN